MTFVLKFQQIASFRRDPSCLFFFGSPKSNTYASHFAALSLSSMLMHQSIPSANIPPGNPWGFAKDP